MLPRVTGKTIRKNCRKTRQLGKNTFMNLRTVSLPRPLAISIVVASLMCTAACDRKVDPSNQVAQHVEAAAFHRSQGSLRAAILECRNALQIDPDNAAAHLELGYIALDTRDGRSADTAFGKAQELGADEEQVRFALTLAYLYSGRYQDTLDLLRDLAGRPGIDADEYNLRRAEAFIGLSRFDEAQSELQGISQC